MQLDNFDFQIDSDVQEKKQWINAKVYRVCINSLMYEPNVKATWMRAEKNVSDFLNENSDTVVFYTVIVDGTNYNDSIAQESVSYEEYKLKCVAKYGDNAPNISEREFLIRQNVKTDDQCYIQIKIRYLGETESVVIGSTFG